MTYTKMKIIINPNILNFFIYTSYQSLIEKQLLAMAKNWSLIYLKCYIDYSFIFIFEIYISFYHNNIVRILYEKLYIYYL